MQRLPRFVFLLLFLSFPLLAETVLVLPFFNYSGSTNLNWIGESVAESIRETLAADNVLVLDREDRLEGFRRLALRQNVRLTHASIMKLAEALDADLVIYGQYELLPPPAPPASGAPSTTSSRGSLRISARILDLKRLRQGKDFTELGALEDLAALETHLGWQSLELVMPAAARSEQEFLKTRPAIRVDAIENYIRGLLASTPDQKHRFFTQAARLDNRYSQPCFQLGKIYWTKKDYRQAATWLEKVNRTDPHYFEAQFFLGLCRYSTGEFPAAEQAFQLVASHVPLNEVFNDLGAAQGRRNTAAAIESFRKALEGDNTDPDYHFNLGYTLWKAGRFTAAVESFRAALERRPDDAEAEAFLDRALRSEASSPGDSRTEGRERLKTDYEETAYRQLKAELEIKK